MPSNKSLPILKLFFAPVLLGTAYGAYCYYSQKHEVKKNNEHAPIKYMEELSKTLKDSKSLIEVKRVYSLMFKHLDRFVVNPDYKNKKLIDNQIVRDVENASTFTSNYKVDRLFKINYFNYKNDKKDGKFTLGFWINLNQISINELKMAEPIIKIAEECLKIRNKKCKNLADLTTNSLQTGYLQQYLQCMGSTANYASKIQRQLDVARKILSYQLVKQT